MDIKVNSEDKIFKLVNILIDCIKKNDKFYKKVHSTYDLFSATSKIAFFKVSLVRNSGSIPFPSPFSTIALIFCGWSAIKGIPTMGTPFAIVSSADCNPPWVTNTLMFGWPK